MPNRRISVSKKTGGSTSSRVTRKASSTRSGMAKPSASAWAMLETEKPSKHARKGMGKRNAFGPVLEEGELIVATLPARFKDDIVRAIERAGAEAERRDPRHVILSMRRLGAGLRVALSENQLAVRIGKKLDGAFKGGSLSITYSDRDRPLRVRWTPPR